MFNNITENQGEKYAQQNVFIFYRRSVSCSRKYTNDEDSAAMLDLIFDTRIVDLGMMFDWGSITGTYDGLAKPGAKDFTTVFASRESAILKAMAKTIDALEENPG